jgi:hypothetical protein
MKLEETFKTTEALLERLPSYDSEPSERSRWPQAETSCKGWVWETPAGPIPFGPMDPNEFLDFVEDCEKTEGGEN